MAQHHLWVKGSNEIARARVFKDGTREAMTRRLREPTPKTIAAKVSGSYYRWHRKDIATTIPFV